MEEKINPAETVSIFYRKYTSLIHILQGEEEFTLNEDGFIVSSNLEAVNVTGYEEHEIIGKHISIFYHAEETEKAKIDLAKAIRLGGVVVTGLRIKKRGVPFWAKMKIKFEHASMSDQSFFKVVLQDTTHRILSKDRINAIRDEYLALFNNPFVGTFKFRTSDNSIQMCNNKTLEILGKESSANLNIESFFALQEEFELFISSLLEEKKLEGFKFLLRDGKNNQNNWAVISIRYFEKSGFAEGILFDISDQYRQMLELQQVNANLDNLVYHASHDLRSPLTTIMGLVNLGIKETSRDLVNTYFEMISGRIQHLDTLLKDLLYVSYNNAESEARDFFHFEVETRAIIHQLQTPNALLKIILDVRQSIDFKTDPIRMRKILWNLLSNAFKYYSPVETVPFVELKVHVFTTHCKIYLKDNGIGIHPEFKEKVYDMFFKATERSRGSGLGLYIVKAMVDKLKGHISFESTLNVGTTFDLTIPNQCSETIL